MAKTKSQENDTVLVEAIDPNDAVWIPLEDGVYSITNIPTEVPAKYLSMLMATGRIKQSAIEQEV